MKEATGEPQEVREKEALETGVSLGQAATAHYSPGCMSQGGPLEVRGYISGGE